ncbi:MAG TPA: SDR family oxidoreductase [Stellaceae bacterium]|nr:SDR family oxidoreductase [Stellaceae bacterium]
MDLKLEGKKAIVTGGTRGIGRAIAEALAAEGCHVAICARHREQIDEAVKALGKMGAKAWGSPVDVADSAALRRWVADAAAALGGLDIFVANVSALAVTADEASWRKSFEIDVMGTVVGVEAALPLLEKSAAGSVVVIGSVAAVEVSGPTRPYNAVKAALVPYIKSLAQNYAKKKVRVNMVSPGTIYFKGGVWHQREQQMPDFFKAALARNPLGRMGTPEEVADAVVFLASPRASFITGSNLIIDGALTQRVPF